MHEASYIIMKEAVLRYLNPEEPCRIIDVGSYEYVGSYRPLFSAPKWSYTGADQRPGPNVDVIWNADLLERMYEWYDVVISGQTIEHVETPWTFIRELNAVCKTGGLVMLVAPWRAPVHKAPLDCWRMLPDGAAALLRWGGFEVLETRLFREAGPDFDNSKHGSTGWGDDTIAIGRKKCVTTE